MGVAHSNDPGLVFLDTILSEKKIVKEKFFFHLFISTRYNSAPIVHILIKKIWPCMTRRALSNDSGPAFPGAILSEKKIVKGKFFFPLFPLNRYNSAPVGQISIKKIWACRARRALSNDPGPVFLDAILSEKKINSAPIGQILIGKIWPCRPRRSLSSDPGPVFPEKFFFPLFPLNSYNSAPVGQISIEKIWACSARRALSNDPGPVFLDAILSEKKMVIEQFYLPLLPINRYNSGPIGHAILSEKKIVKEKFLFHLFPSNRYYSAPIIQIFIKKILACRTQRALSNDSGPAFPGAILSEKEIVKEKFFFPLFPLNRYNTAPVGQILIKKIWACSARRSLSNGPVGQRISHTNVPGLVFLGATDSEKKIVKKKFFFPLFPLNHYNSAPIDLDKQIWACRARRALSSDPGAAFVGAILSEKNIVKEKFYFPLFPINRYNSAPIVQILIKKIWACMTQGALSNDSGPAFPGAILSEKKIVKGKFFFPLFPLNRYNSAPVGQILIKKIWACRARRALSNNPGRVFLGATLSEKKIVKEKLFLSLFPLNQLGSYWSDLDKQIWACRARRALSSDPGAAFVGAILSEKNNVKEKFYFPLFPINRYNSAPIVQILIKKIWACMTQGALSNDSGPAFPGAILSEKKIVKGKFFFPLFPLNRYNSAPVGQILIKKIWARRARRALSNNPGRVFLGATLSEKKINSAPIGQILIRKIWPCRPRRSLSSDPGPVFLVSEKKIVTEKFFFPLFPLNRYNSAPVGQIFIEKIWACSARRALSNDPGPVFLDAILSEKKIKKIVTEKFFFPLFPLNRYNSAPVGQILIGKIWACRARKALSSDPSPAFVGAIVSEKKMFTEKFFFPLFPSNRYNSVPVGQIFIEKIWACSTRRALSNDPGPVFLDAILSEIKIVIEQFYLPLLRITRYNSGPIGHAILSEKKIVKEKFLFHLFPSNRYNSAAIIQILIKKILACRTQRALSNDSGPAFAGATLSEKEIVKEKVFFPLFPLNRYNTAPVGQIFCKKNMGIPFQWPGRVFLGAIVSEKKIVKEKFFFPFIPLNSYKSAPIGQILI
ncbi:LOW QUALITY PROTEIN: hypothetical protein V1477_017778 [Vespula maculifrons]|uniref:Uncharacterized protein n=1 Tax=Vespula maculifrons TaxID=7453 RepID=A0ABD2B132_VESMC